MGLVGFEMECIGGVMGVRLRMLVLMVVVVVRMRGIGKRIHDSNRKWKQRCGFMGKFLRGLL